MKRMLVLALSLCLTLTSLQAAESPSDLPHAVLSIGGQAGDGFAEGFGDILAPIYLTESGLWFLNPRFTAGDNGEEETNIGIGYRHLIPGKNVIVGANVYYDARCTEHDNKFHQLGLGLELLTEWVDARANLYLPEDDEELVDRYTAQEVSVDSGSQWYDPYADGHSIEQDGKWWRTTTTTTYLYERFERARQGWDAEIGVKIPVSPRFGEYRVFGGYYDWEAQYVGGDDINGFKGRAEARVFPFLYLDAQVFENSDLNGTDWTVGGRLVLPFDLVSLSHGENPFAGINENSDSGESPFSDRLFEMVIRDLQVRMENSDYRENVAARQVESSVEKGGLHETLLDDIMFVAQDRGADTNPGTYEEPKETISNGVVNAFGERNVFVYSSQNEYDENVPVPDNTQVYGEGSTLEGRGGRVYGGGMYPIVDGQSLGPAFSLGNNTFLSGFRVINTALGGPLQNDPVLAVAGYERVGVYAGNADNVRIDNVIAENCTIGGLLVADATLPNFRTTVSRSKFRNNDQIGLLIEGVAGAAGTFSTHILDSTFNDNLTGSGLTVNPTTYADSWIDVRRVTANNNGGDGMTLVPAGNAQDSHIMVMDVQAGGNSNFGVQAIPTAATRDSFLTVSGVKANRNDEGGMNLVPTAIGRDSFLWCSDVVANNNGVYGALVVPTGIGRDSYSVCTDMQLNENGTWGLLHVPTAAGRDMMTESSRIQANDNGQWGVQFLSVAAGRDLTAVMHDITANNTSNGWGVLFGAQGAGRDLVADVRRVTANDNGTHGLQLDAGGGQESTSMTVTDVEALRNGAHGVFSTVSGESNLTSVLFNRIVANDNASNGVNVVGTSATGSINAVFRNVAASGNDIGGMFDVSTLAGVASLRIADSTFNGNVGPFGGGLVADVTASNGTARTVLSGVNASGNLDIGLSSGNRALGTAGGDSYTILRNVHADNNGFYGMFVVGESASGNTTISIDPSSANDNGVNGARILGFAGGGDLLIDIEDFDTVGNGTYGLEILGLATGAGHNATVNLTNVRAMNNLNQGVRINMESQNGAAYFNALDSEASGNTAQNFDLDIEAGAGEAVAMFDNFNADDSSTLLGMYIAVEANGAGNQALVDMQNLSADGNAFFGILADVQSFGGDAKIMGTGVSADGNSSAGMNLQTIAWGPAGNTLINLSNATADNNSTFGMDLLGYSVGGTAGMALQDSHANNNLGLYGMKMALNGVSGPASVTLNNFEASGNASYGADMYVLAGGVNNDINFDFTHVIADMNGTYGFTVNGIASGSASLTIDGGRADGNGTYGFSGNVTGNGGDATVDVDGFRASGNTQFGFSAGAIGNGVGGTALVDLFHVRADGNGQFGILAGVVAANGPASLIVGDSRANDNTGYGLMGTVSAGNGAALVDLSDLTLNGNGTYGMHIGATAVGAGNDVTMNLADVGASGNVQYGMTLNGTALAGAGYLNVTGGEADTNGTYGFSGNITGGDGVAMASVNGFEADGNGQFGLAASATASGAGNAATVDLRNTSAGANGAQGVIVGLIGNAGDAVLFGQNLEIRNNVGNGAELYTYPLGGGIYRLDLGGGSEGSLGLNSIVGNGGIGVANMVGGTVSVENNFWDGLAPVLGVDYNAGVTPPASWLATDPN